MTTDEIIAMAKEAGLLPDNSHPAPETRAMRQRTNAVQRFAALVAAAEREACAQVCDTHARGWKMNPGQIPEAGFVASSNCADSCRARGGP